MHKEMWMIDIYRELGQVYKAIEKAKRVMEDDRFPNLKVYGAIRLLGIYADCKSDKATELIRVIDGIVIPETKAYEDYLCLKAKYYDNIGNTDEAEKILHELKDKGKYTKSKSFAEENLRRVCNEQTRAKNRISDGYNGGLTESSSDSHRQPK